MGGCFGGTGDGFYSAQPKEMRSRFGAAGVVILSAQLVPARDTLVYVIWVLRDEALMKRWGAKVRGR